MFITDIEHRTHYGVHYPALQWWQSEAIRWQKKAVSSFYWTSCFSMIRNIGKTIEFHEHKSFAKFICYKMNSSVRANTLEYTVKFHRSFCKSIDGGFGRSIVDREGKSTSKVSLYVSKNKTLPLSLWKKFNINLLLGYWMILLGIGVT